MTGLRYSFLAVTAGIENDALRQLALVLGGCGAAALLAVAFRDFLGLFFKLRCRRCRGFALVRRRTPRFVSLLPKRYVCRQCGAKSLRLFRF